MNDIRPKKLIDCMKAIHNSDGSKAIDSKLKSILARSKSKEHWKPREKIPPLELLRPVTEPRKD